MTPATERRFTDTSLDSWDKGMNDGTFGNMSLKALNLVEEYPGRTPLELLQVGIETEVYTKQDPNQIRPRLNGLWGLGEIIRGSKRKCTVSGRMAYTYRRNYNVPKRKNRTHGPKAIHIIERESISEPGKIHTTIYWNGGAITCTCRGCATHDHCNGSIGLRLAVDGIIRTEDYEYIIGKIGRTNVKRILEV